MHSISFCPANGIAVLLLIKKITKRHGISANYLHGKCVTHYCWQLLSCHIPPKGSKKAFDYYDSIRSNIDEIIARIEKQPDEKRFMPFKHPRLIDATIRCL